MMTMTNNIDAMFKRKRGRPPKNRVIEVSRKQAKCIQKVIYLKSFLKLVSCPLQWDYLQPAHGPGDRENGSRGEIITEILAKLDLSFSSAVRAPHSTAYVSNMEIALEV